MIKKLLISIGVFLLAIQLNAQLPTLIGSTTYAASGAGVTGKIPNVSWNIPAGKNRAMIVRFYFERTQFNSANIPNWPGPHILTNANAPATSVGGVALTPNGNAYWIYGNESTLPTANRELTYQSIIYTLKDSQGLPTGVSTFDFSSINTPKEIGDDVIVSIEVFANVSPTSTLGIAGSKSWNNLDAVDNGGLSSFSNSFTAATVPLNRSATDILYSTSVQFSQSGITKTVNSPWVITNDFDKTNSNGSSTNVNWNTAPPQNEADGISILTANAFGTTAGPPALFTISRGGNTTLIANLSMRALALLPLASPIVRGTVFRDTDGNTNINGIGTNVGAGFVNVVNSSGVVVYSAPVAANGTYTIPAGYIFEGESYTMVLATSATSTTPSLNVGWTNVGEATATTGNDGLANGIINVTAGLIDLSNYNFGINTCFAGSTAPVVNSNLSIVCPATSVNLNSAYAGTPPVGSNLVWFNNNTHTGAALSGPAVSTAGPGTYYAFFYDNVGTCYSPASNAVVVKQICANNDTYNPTASQATSGTTFPVSVLNNDTYNNATATTSNVNITIVSGATGTVVPTLDPITGLVTVPANTPQGTYTITYQICEKVSGTPCDTATITVVVPITTIIADDDNFTTTPITSTTGGSTASVFANDNYNGGADGTVNSSNATATQNGIWPSGITLNPSTGQIAVAPGTPPGDYAVTYQICDKVNPGVCDLATVTIRVNATIQADDDNFSSTPISSQTGGTTISVLSNDNYNGGPDGSATVGASGNVTLSPTGTAWPSGFTLNADGTVSVGTGVAPGSYVLNYQICDKILGSPCDSAQITIVVVAGYCYHLPTTNSGVTVPTKHGITALNRAGVDSGNWPMVRQSSWTTLEAKTKGFVVNRVSFDASGNPVGIATANFVEGMMVYDITNNCLKIYNGAAWSCYSTPACP